MTQSPHLHQQTTNHPPTAQQAAILLIKTILDTTWRAFVPTIGGTILGVTLDSVLGVAPVITTIMIIAGFAISALLIAMQIRKIRRV